jgi:hypothetical protein
MAREAGITDRQLQHPAVARLSRDTYLPRAVVGEPSARLAAVLLTAPPGAVVSHATAAGLWGVQVPLQVERSGRVDLTVPMSSRSESRRDRRVHRTPLPEEDRTRRGALPVTTPARTWRDLAAVLTPPALLAVTDQFLARWVTRDELDRQLRGRPTGRGSARAREVLPVADPRAESPMESEARLVMIDGGLPIPELQYEAIDGNRELRRLDFAWPDLRVAVEYDGLDWHGDPEAMRRDRRRRMALQDVGWIVITITFEDVRHRAWDFVARINRELRNVRAA